jgi:hypothetical protein
LHSGIEAKILWRREFHIEILFLKQLTDEMNEEAIIEYEKCLENGTFGEPNLPEAKKYFKITIQKRIDETCQDYIRGLEKKYYGE